MSEHAGEDDGYRAIVERSPDAILLHAQGRVLYVNPAALRLLGAQEPAQLVGRSVLEVVHPAYHATIKERMRAGYEESKEVPPIVERLVRVDGTHFEAEVYAAPLTWRGQPAVQVVARDITDRRRAEEERHRLFQMSVDLLLVSGRNGRVRQLNPAWTRTLGWTLDELMAQPLMAFMHPDDVERTRALGDQLEEGRNLVVFENRYRTREGAWRWISWSAAQEGEVIFAVGRDVTERRAALEALQESEYFLRESQRVARLGSFVFDVVADRWTASPVLDEILGIDAAHPHTLAGWLALVADAEREAMREYYAGLLASHGRFDREFPILRPQDGTPRWVHCKAEFTGGADGMPLRMVGTLQDITDRRRAEAEQRLLTEQLHQAQKMETVGRLAGGVAHDFNNILCAIEGYTEMALQEATTGQAPLEALRIIHDSTVRAAALTRQLLAFSRHQPMAARPVALSTIVGAVEELLRRSVGERVKLAVHIDQDATVVADANQLENAVVNLGVNARDAMPEGGVLEIRVGQREVTSPQTDAGHGTIPPGTWALIRVRDSGTGMTEEARRRLFEPFFTTKERGQGTGLGLPLVYGVVRQHQGHVLVDTQAGVGTTVDILLPPASGPAPAVAAPASSPPPDDELRGGTETILLVEDEPSILKLVARSLAALGYRVLCAADGAEALEVSRAEPGAIDLLLSDVVLPGRSGPQVAAELRLARPGLQVVFMSGYAPDALDDIRLVQPALLLEKPIGPTVLAQRIRDWLDHGR
ncbi:MAG: PAS domain S-box protein [Deltaproteobacteria bacterium]|nr:PAS domain S-box protein [Deltaproteobacteria bacterium]